MVDNQSAIHLQWLTCEEDQKGVLMEHAGSGHKVKFEEVCVDGVWKMFENSTMPDFRVYKDICIATMLTCALITFTEQLIVIRGPKNTNALYSICVRLQRSSAGKDRGSFKL